MLIGSTLVDMCATCGILSDAYKLFDKLRSLKVGANHMALHEGMFIHAEIMSYTKKKRTNHNRVFFLGISCTMTFNVMNYGIIYFIEMTKDT